MMHGTHVFRILNLLVGALKFFYELSSHETLEEGESTRWIHDL